MQLLGIIASYSFVLAISAFGLASFGMIAYGTIKK